MKMVEFAKPDSAPIDDYICHINVAQQDRPKSPLPKHRESRMLAMHHLCCHLHNAACMRML